MDRLKNIEPTIDFTYKLENNTLSLLDILLTINQNLKFITNSLIKMTIYEDD